MWFVLFLYTKHYTYNDRPNVSYTICMFPFTVISLLSVKVSLIKIITNIMIDIFDCGWRVDVRSYFFSREINDQTSFNKRQWIYSINVCLVAVCFSSFYSRSIHYTLTNKHGNHTNDQGWVGNMIDMDMRLKECYGITRTPASLGFLWGPRCSFALLFF